jgi:hypothetical protein
MDLITDMTSFFKFFAQIWLHWQQSHIRRMGRRIDKNEEKGFRQQWFLLTGLLSQSDLIQKPNVQALNPIYPPENAFWADPFLWIHEGRRYVFFEDFPFETSRGRISVIEIDAVGQKIGDSIPVLETPHHLSYPFLFEYQDVLYMIPEQTEIKRVDLYRCTEFPHAWVFEKTLIDGIKIADPTMFEYDGRWWIFCAAKQGKIRINESLFAFYADSPLSSQWTAHSANPLVRDLRLGRQAGRIFQDASGRLLRPSQDCLRRYGHGLNLSEIHLLTPTDYQESLLWKINGDEIGMRAIHHIDCKAGLVVMDAQRLMPQKSSH